MPTYTFRCAACGDVQHHVMTMREYCASPPAFVHCGKLTERFFETVPALAIHNALAGDRHYDGMRATDGTDISSRSKHREYMRANDLTTVDDYTNTWAQAETKRREVFSGQDNSRAGDIAAAIDKLSST